MVSTAIQSAETILVTGGCGFIGANLVPMLEEAGYSVRVLDNLAKGDSSLLAGCRAEIVVGDIRDCAAVAQALEGVDAVIHLAAFGSVVESVAAPAENFDVNARGTFVVLDECRKRGIARFVFASTGGALIGNADPPVNEDSRPRPISPYGSSKLCGEAYCSSFAHSYNMHVTALRFANVVGPCSWHKKGAVTAFAKAIMSQDPLRIFGDGSATRDFLYVEDLCKGIGLALRAALPGFNPLHLASGREVSIGELARLMARIAGDDNYPIEYAPKRAGEVDRNFARFDRASALLGFEPQYSLEEGLTRTWEWFELERSKRGSAGV
ncbi:hypothetical protein CKO31_17290 [Thiohalocapsa halophila]|uniref:NAD-dependent epimerase/dehydratase domain-containing protein n=1 Tax=Thiohalocapsa halophila TaxID=69359 RepID=A0ABS1CKK8_9GAMM|nr:NAD-dependent epimerase/dehydratase family protein [Thiohalocapsa halophila]MBK1632463.1 hypothetical protein [Thiohalocapsa halophila]